MRIFALLLLCMSPLIPLSDLWATTHYVRPDGGTSDQCTGTGDAAYSGTGTNQPGAWAHPTRILGAGWHSGCSNPPEPWGTQRSYYIIGLTGSFEKQLIDKSVNVLNFVLAVEQSPLMIKACGIKIGPQWNQN